jgi:hypothetical protein
MAIVAAAAAAAACGSCPMIEQCTACTSVIQSMRLRNVNVFPLGVTNELVNKNWVAVAF